MMCCDNSVLGFFNNDRFWVYKGDWMWGFERIYSGYFLRVRCLCQSAVFWSMQDGNQAQYSFVIVVKVMVI